MDHSPAYVRTLLDTIQHLRADNVRLKTLCNEQHPGSNERITDLLSLPPELLDRIFSSLSDRRADIAACRLVCKAFKVLSSPFLITRIIVSKRVDAIRKVCDILDHPIFSKCITELVYDASTYREECAVDFEEYCDAANASTGRSYIGSRLDEDTSEYRSLIDRVRRLSEDDGDVSIFEPTFGEPLMGLLQADEYDEAFRDYHHLGFHQYALKWYAQHSIVEDNVHEAVIGAAFLRFPKLRHVVFTDWRGMVRHNEVDYGQFCSRILGLSAEPEGLSDWKQNISWNDIWTVLRKITKARAKGHFIESFAIGTHPWSIPLAGLLHVDFPKLHPHQLPPSVPMTTLARTDRNNAEDAKRNKSMALEAFKGLQSLRLPIKFTISSARSEPISQSLLPQILAKASETLVELLFSVEDNVTFRQDSDSDTPKRFKIIGNRGDTLKQVLFCLHFPMLQRLDLRGWAFDALSFQKWLADHSATLRQLRLINNLIEGDVRKLAKFGGEHMHLTGMAMCNHPASYEEPANSVKIPVPTESATYNESLEQLWLAGRYNTLCKLGGDEDWRQAEKLTT